MKSTFESQCIKVIKKKLALNSSTVSVVRMRWVLIFCDVLTILKKKQGRWNPINRENLSRKTKHKIMKKVLIPHGGALKIFITSEHNRYRLLIRNYVWTKDNRQGLELIHKIHLPPCFGEHIAIPLAISWIAFQWIWITFTRAAWFDSLLSLSRYSEEKNARG